MHEKAIGEAEIKTYCSSLGKKSFSKLGLLLLFALMADS